MSQNLSQLRKFVSPEIIFGAGSRHSVGNYAKTFGARKVLLVSDPGVVVSTPSDDCPVFCGASAAGAGATISTYDAGTSPSLYPARTLTQPEPPVISCQRPARCW